MSDFGSKSLPEITCYCTRFGAASPGLRSGSLAGLVTGRAWPEPLLLGASGGTGAVDRGGRGLGLALGDPWTSGQRLGAPGGRAGPPGGQKGLWRHLLEAGLHGSLWGARPKGHIKSPLDGTGVDTGGRGWPGWTEGLSTVGRGGRGWAWEPWTGVGGWTLQTVHRSLGLRLGGRKAGALAWRQRLGGCRGN